MANQYGLEWVKTAFGIKPQWTEEPDAAQVGRLLQQHLKIVHVEAFTVTSHRTDAFSKLYCIETIKSGKWLVRVQLPVEPCWMTASEVATLDFVRQNTSIPVPKVLASDPSNLNGLQFEWMLMEHRPGAILERRWRRIHPLGKSNLITSLARIAADLYAASTRSTRIGSIYPGEGPGQYAVGRMISIPFFWGDRAARRDIARGPFENSYDWLFSRLDLFLQAQVETLDNSTDEDDIEEATVSKALADRLLRLLPRIFPPDAVCEPVTLSHIDMSDRNILVDDSGSITAVLDWGCSVVVPRWMACQPPTLLDGAYRDEQPLRTDYAAYNPAVDGPDVEHSRGMSELYWEHQLEYEKWVWLEKFFEQMASVEPRWLQEFVESQLQRDFELAVTHLGGPFSGPRVTRWLDAVESANSSNLWEMLNGERA
ncbi:kinase-like protein [Zymoseptoria brevis]|uniref:Kinase-like protein n=1 Tax=Zymoseptoria brevis TaxID=1047168 RepID=A0A0F4GPT7_9PEZI|nr:kinase-like protein [Zymoseptoria brevis]